MSLTGLAPFEDFVETGFKTWEMVGNGLSAREAWNAGFRFATVRVALGIFCAEVANGEETAGRVTDIVIVAGKGVSFRCERVANELTHVGAEGLGLWRWLEGIKGESIYTRRGSNTFRLGTTGRPRHLLGETRRHVVSIKVLPLQPHTHFSSLRSSSEFLLPDPHGVHLPSPPSPIAFNDRPTHRRRLSITGRRLIMLFGVCRTRSSHAFSVALSNCATLQFLSIYYSGTPWDSPMYSARFASCLADSSSFNCLFISLLWALCMHWCGSVSHLASPSSGFLGAHSTSKCLSATELNFREKFSPQ